MFLKSFSFGLMGFLLLNPSAFSYGDSHPAQPSQGVAVYEQALRNRIENYYSLMQLARFEEAETYVTAETRENFRRMPKNPFLSYEISSIQFEPEHSSVPEKAHVSASMQVFIPPTPQPMSVPVKTTWVYKDKIWLLEQPKVESPNFQDLFKGGRKAAPPPPEEVKFADLHADLGNKVVLGSKPVAHFSFKNIVDHPVRLEVKTFCECLVVKNLKKEYKAGESGELEIEFDTTNYIENYAQSIFVTSQPGGAQTKLLITAYIPRPQAASPKPE